MGERGDEERDGDGESAAGQRAAALGVLKKLHGSVVASSVSACSDHWVLEQL